MTRPFSLTCLVLLAAQVAGCFIGPALSPVVRAGVAWGVR